MRPRTGRMDGFYVELCDPAATQMINYAMLRQTACFTWKHVISGWALHILDGIPVENTFLHVKRVEIMILLASYDILEGFGAMPRNLENP